MSVNAKAYVLRLVLNLPPSVDLHRFRVVWNDMTGLFPILRTRIVHTESGVLIQVLVADPVPWTEGENLHQYLEDDTEDHMVLGGRLWHIYRPDCSTLLHTQMRPTSPVAVAVACATLDGKLKMWLAQTPRPNWEIALGRREKMIQRGPKKDFNHAHMWQYG
ncbi:hypothetical protein TruAng_005869 [Truncatella angustata]|nr:hypothetical protein TruAng_005869 [Truncatella angustata]